VLLQGQWSPPTVEDEGSPALLILGKRVYGSIAISRFSQNAKLRVYEKLILPILRLVGDLEYPNSIFLKLGAEHVFLKRIL
jgi:hypothetical protein